MMKKFSISLLLAFALALGVAGQRIDPVESNLRKDVAYLAGDALEGRRTGEPGATNAAGYIANLFARYKLKPGVVATNGTKSTQNYLQKFPYTADVSAAATGNDLTVGGARLGADVRPYLFSPSAKIGETAVVFAGYGIERPEVGYHDFAGLDVAGKIVLVFDGNPENDNPRSAFSRFTPHAKAKLAKDKGAVGLIIISREDDFSTDRNVRARYDQTTGETAVPVMLISRDAAAKTFFRAKSADLKAFEKFYAGKVSVALPLSVQIGDGRLPAAALEVNLVRRVTDAYNVIGVVEGTDPVLKNEYVVIGAHYDHLGRGGQGSLAVNSNEIHHGADDNASGTSAMIELARQFAAQRKNKRTIIFMAYGGEEEGLLGSKFYVNNPLFPLEKTVAMLNMDMVGRLTEDKLTVGGIGTANEWRGMVEQLNQTAAFKLQLNEDGFGPSDHASFYGKQIPVLFFFTGTHADYHKPSDTADKVNYAGLMKISAFVGQIARQVADAPQKPTYKVAQSSGQGDGRRGFAVTIGVVPGYGETNDGMVLDGVRDGSPAALAGLRGGDKIISFAGKEIRNVQDYTLVLGDLKAGVEYEIVVMRGTEKVTLKVKPAARP